MTILQWNSRKNTFTDNRKIRPAEYDGIEYKDSKFFDQNPNPKFFTLSEKGKINYALKNIE